MTTVALNLVAVSCASEGAQSTSTASPRSPVTPAPIPAQSDIPVIPPEQRDSAFANALSSKNLQVGDPETRVQVARSVCEALDAGASLPDLVASLQQALGGPAPENTSFIIGSATAIYCPQNIDKLRNK